MRQKSDYLDSLFWVTLPMLLLGSIGIGSVSGDGLTQSERYLGGSWLLNPNHLLYEPVGALWLTTINRVAPFRSPPDLLKLLSILNGAIAAGAYRLLASHIFESRVAKNLSTAALAFSAGFLVHWISDETHMVQMPWLVLFAAALWYCCEAPSAPRALGVGAAGGAVSLWYVSNVTIVVCAAFALCEVLRRRAGVSTAARVLALAGVGTTVTFGSVALLSWQVSAVSHTTFVSWLSTYAGGEVTVRVADAYGVGRDFHSALLSMARTAFGVASALVDQSALAAQLRGERNDLARVITDLVALSILCVALLYGIARHSRSRAASEEFVLPMLGWITGVSLFALYWNNSDAQFYFQLAVPFAYLLGKAVDQRGALSWMTTLVAVPLIWNVVAITKDNILFPRQRKVDELRRLTEGAALIIVPGHDEAEQMLFFLHLPRSRTISLTNLVETQFPDDGNRYLDSAVTAVIKSGRSVVTVGIVGANSKVMPWKYIEKFGYSQLSISRAIIGSHHSRPVRSDLYNVLQITN